MSARLCLGIETCHPITINMSGTCVPTNVTARYNNVVVTPCCSMMAMVRPICEYIHEKVHMNVQNI